MMRCPSVATPSLNSPVRGWVACCPEQLAKRRSLAHQLQDVQCAKCKGVKRTHLAPFCATCASGFGLRMSRERMASGLDAFANIASFHGMPWLQETVDFLRVGLLLC